MPYIQHNSIRGITAELLTEVCPNVGIKLTLQPWMVRCSTSESPTLRIRQDWTSRLRIFGTIAGGVLSLMWQYSTPMLFLIRCLLQKTWVWIEKELWAMGNRSRARSFHSFGRVFYRWLGALSYCGLQESRKSHITNRTVTPCTTSGAGWPSASIHSAVACLRDPRSFFHAPAREINLINHLLDLIRSEVSPLD